jgi:hypothetical protein
VRGPYTRFSSSGGGQLDGFEAGGDERYTLEQWQQGFAWKLRGWSVQQELHHKDVEDHEETRRSTLAGGYAQLGRVWHLPWVPARARPLPVELAGRYARVEWTDTPADRTEEEMTLVVNVFFDGHENKLTADVSRLEVRQPPGMEAHDVRFRLQWDVSF